MAFRNPNKSERSPPIISPTPFPKDSSKAREDFSVIVSGDGFLYLMSNRTGRILWSHNLNTKVYYGWYEGNSLTDPVAVKANLDSDLELYHKHSRKKIDWDNNANKLEEYLKEKFGEIVSFHSFKSDPLYLAFTNGKHPNPHQNKVSIVRSAFMISMHAQDNIWRVNFSLYEATLCGISGKKIFPIKVRHSFDDSDLIRYCEETSLKYPRSSNINVISDRIQLKDKCITVREPPEFVKESRLLVGKYSKFRAAVKKLTNTDNLTEKLETLTATDLHDNVVRFFGGELSEEGDFLLAFELHDSYLYDHLMLMSDFHGYKPYGLVKTIRGIIQGVEHVHSKQYYHGRLSPWKVVANDKLTKLCELTNCQKSDEESRLVDFKDIAKIISFCHMPADFLKRHNTEEEYKKLDTKVLMDAIEQSGEVEAYDLCNLLMNGTKQEIKSVLQHSWFWGPIKRLDFIKDVNALIAETGPVTALVPVLRQKLTKRFAWKHLFPPELVTVMEHGINNNRYNYDYDSLLDLLRFIRNVVSHRIETKPRLTQRIEFLIENHIAFDFYLRTNFKWLLVDLYKRVKEVETARLELSCYLEARIHDW